LGKKKNTPGSNVLLSIAAFVVVIAGAMASASILTPFLLALFVSIISIQPVLWLTQKGLNNTLSVVLVVVLIIGLFIGLGAVLGNSVNGFAQDAPIYAKKLREIGHGITNALQARGINLTFDGLDGNFDPARIMNYTANVLTEFGAIMSNAFLIFFIVLFMLLERASIRMKAEIIATSYNNNLTVMTSIINSIRSYLGLKTIISLLTGVFIWLWLLVFGVEYALLWGLIAFLLNYIPNIGSIIAGVPAVLFALVQLGFGAAGWAFLGYVLVNTIVGNVVEPRVMGKEMGLSTLIVFLSLIFWGFVLGTVGMFLAVPLTMTFKIILDQYPKTKWLSILLGSDEQAIEMDLNSQSDEPNIKDPDKG
jgi:AI-2 transport protein TqsA